MDKTAGIRYMVYSVFFFTLMNIGVKSLAGIPTSQVVLFRALVSLLICYMLLKKEKIPVWGKNKLYLILRGLMGTGALILYFYTLQNMPLATAVGIQKLSPVFSVILAVFMLKEKIKPAQVFFLLLSLAGVFVIKGFDSNVTLFLLLTGITSAVFSSLAYNFVRKLRDYDHHLVVVFYFPLVTMPVITPFAIVEWVQPNLSEWAILILVGIFTQIAQVYMTRAYQSTEVSGVAVYNYLDIVFAILLGYILFGETISFSGLAGIIMVVGGAVLNTVYRNK